MQQFIYGFVAGLLALGSVVAFILRTRSRKELSQKTEGKKQLEQLSKLTGGLAHEIKNPLSIIKVNLKLISEQLQASENADQQKLSGARRKITVIEKEADRLEQILEDFLRYTDMSQLQLTNVDINELISDVCDFYLPQARSHSITMRQGTFGQPLVCKIDSDMLKQVILNLFINAQQAMTKGGELMIRTDKQDDNAVIRISDTGTGIAADKLANIFKAYYSTRPAGSGLGLPTAKKIVEAHSGTLTVDSEPGKGTLFTINLPIHKT